MPSVPLSHAMSPTKNAKICSLHSIMIHPILDRTPCDIDGDDLEPGALPPPPDDHTKGDFSPFANCAKFELAELLYVEAEMSVGKIDRLLTILTLLYDAQPPFTSHQELYMTIDAIKQGEIPWNSFSVAYNGVHPQQNPPAWMDASYKIWFRSTLQVLEGQISNPKYNNMMDFMPKWDDIVKKEATHRAMFALVVLGSDKTTVSVATGQNDFYLLYTVKLSHSLHFFQFQRHPKTDYPEQALLAGTMQGWCPICSAPHNDLDGEMFMTAFPHANIHQVLTQDLLHQLIKGTFKDHIVTWVEKYIRETHLPAWADKILADIDRCIAAVLSFPGLRHFHKGHGLKQWTGNDLKGLMKVYLPAIVRYIPSEMIKAVLTLIDLFHLV
ncbi:hypothetical protein EI94DRAFT_1698590 [Lactarius quietus]|nr:hypothetical protein EI94DRAFT_1698590 [Lactarius quietus]